MDLEERLVVQILTIVRKLGANNGSSVDWNAFFETYRKKYGIISERKLWDHVSYARELNLLKADLIQGVSPFGKPFYSGKVDALTSLGNKYIRDYKLNCFKWFGPRFERIIWIFVTAIVGILAAKLF